MVIQENNTFSKRFYQFLQGSLGFILIMEENIKNSQRQKNSCSISGIEMHLLDN